jgi:hypothetical protein
MELKENILNLELRLLTPEVRSSREILDQLLADDFMEYGSAGLVYDKNITLENLTSSQSPTYHLYDFEIILLSDFVVQTRYKTDRINLDGTKLTSLRSSLWKNTNDNWQIFFHQGTPIK